MTHDPQCPRTPKVQALLNPNDCEFCRVIGIVRKEEREAAHHAVRSVGWQSHFDGTRCVPATDLHLAFDK